MGNVVHLWNQWEIHVLVLLSFMLQVFLFNTGSRRQRSINSLLRLFMWAAYLGADWVPVYTLGFLSRKDAPTGGGGSGGIPPLAMIWVPFLLVHLGGPDNITAFAIEDNNLWVRHLLSFGLQFVVALYVIWKSAGWRDMHLLVPCIFVFVAGIIKYGERTISLKNGNLKSLQSFKDPGASTTMTPEGEQRTYAEREYPSVISTALNSMQGVHHFFSGRTIYKMNDRERDVFFRFSEMAESSYLSLMKVLEIELGMVYDDLYTKATVLHTRLGVILRCISMVSTYVALALFIARNKERYSRADVVITYTLFAGGIFMDSCALLMTLLSPRTWCWLNSDRRFRWIARVSMPLLLNRLGVSKHRTLWSNSMGQYDLVSYLGRDNARSTSWKQGVMKMIRRTVDCVRVGKGMLPWFSKCLDTRYVKVDMEIIQGLSKYIHRVPQERYGGGSGSLNLEPLLKRIARIFADDFGAGIILLHAFTELHLRKYDSASASDPTREPIRDMDALSDMGSELGIDGDQLREGPMGGRETVPQLAKVCQKLSSYMLYIKINYQQLFPTDDSTEAALKSFSDKISWRIYGNSSDILNTIEQVFNSAWERELSNTIACMDTLKELQQVWIRIIMYVAGKSRPEMHAAQLPRGGELLTFVWLLMLHYRLGDYGMDRIELFPPGGHGLPRGSVIHVFDFDYMPESPMPESPNVLRYA